MKLFRKIIVATAALLVCIILRTSVMAEANCGALEERLLYDTDFETEPTEYPWIGLLLHVRDDISENADCNVIIVGPQHVLVPIICTQVVNNQPSQLAVLLGIWDASHNTSEEYICNDKGFCVPAPIRYEVADFITHPTADKDTNVNYVAILRLTRLIKMNAYAQPICLQSGRESTTLTDRIFQYSGFNYEPEPVKGKGDAVIISRGLCQSEFVLPINQFCALPDKSTEFYYGTSLMGLNIEQNEPQSFYLIGMMVNIKSVILETTFVFQDLRPLIPWILETMALSKQ